MNILTTPLLGAAVIDPETGISYVGLPGFPATPINKTSVSEPSMIIGLVFVICFILFKKSIKVRQS